MDKSKSHSICLWQGAPRIVEVASLISARSDFSVETALKSRVPGLYMDFWKACPFCRSAYDPELFADFFPQLTETAHLCLECGFFYLYSRHYRGQLPDRLGVYRYILPSLKSFDINDELLPLHEICLYLRRHFDDVYYLHWRVFEKIIAEVYRELGGYRVRLTARSRDDGVDVVLLEKGGGGQVLIECKRLRKNGTVGIGVVDRLLGVQFRKGVNRGKIITTGRFTKPARAAARQATERQADFELDLLDADALLGQLGVFRAQWPRIPDEYFLYFKSQGWKDGSQMPTWGEGGAAERDIRTNVEPDAAPDDDSPLRGLHAR